MPAPSRPRRIAPIAVTSALVILLAAGGVGVWLHGRHSTHTPPHNGGQVAVGATQAASPAQAVATPSVPSPTQTAGGGTVTVSSSAAEDPDSEPVAAFLGEYFSAINSHDYQSYASLLSPQEQANFTEAQFRSGYASTTDSAETLTGITTAANGDTVATVTFTSNQDAAQSVDHTETCTNWNISLFLEHAGASYLIDPPPPDYRAAHSSCA
jgi:hypothetical protein